MEIDRIQILEELLNDEIILYKFLTLIKGKSRSQVPAKFTNDIKAGIKYTISALTDQELFSLYFLYINNFTEEHICKLLDTDPSELTNLKTKGKHKLLAKWGYIQYGIEGWLKKREKHVYDKGYIQGHKAGYQQGLEDSANPSSFSSNELLSLPIEYLCLSTHARHCLLHYQYLRVGDIASLSDVEIMRMHGMGKGTANEIAHALNRLGVKHTEWDQFLL